MLVFFDLFEVFWLVIGDVEGRLLGVMLRIGGVRGEWCFFRGFLVGV